MSFSWFSDVNDIAAWTGVAIDVWDAVCVALGCTKAGSLRSAGAMSAADFEVVVIALQPGGGPPTLSVLAGWRLMERLARLSTDAEQTRAQTVAAAAAQATARAVAQALQPQAQHQCTKVGMTKLATTLDQGLDDEIPTISDTDITTGYTSYETRMGKPPSEDREPSAEQITAIKHLLSLSAPPYVDFSVFGPRCIRMRKRMRQG